jgi:hypothetical protein
MALVCVALPAVGRPNYLLTVAGIKCVELSGAN